jgi:hypothetical protein
LCGERWLCGRDCEQIRVRDRARECLQTRIPDGQERQRCICHEKRITPLHPVVPQIPRTAADSCAERCDLGEMTGEIVAHRGSCRAHSHIRFMTCLRHVHACRRARRCVLNMPAWQHALCTWRIQDFPKSSRNRDYRKTHQGQERKQGRIVRFQNREQVIFFMVLLCFRSRFVAGAAVCTQCPPVPHNSNPLSEGHFMYRRIRSSMTGEAQML